MDSKYSKSKSNRFDKIKLEADLEIDLQSVVN